VTDRYMQLDEHDTMRLLVLIAAIDGRSWPGTQAEAKAAIRATALSWRETIRRELEERRDFALTWRLAEDAVYAWYGREPRWNIRPAGILDMATEIRRDRLDRTRLPDPPEHPAPGGWAADAEGFAIMRRAGEDVIAVGGTRQDAADAMAAVAAARPRELNGARR
jgi:hypothetical protein